MFDPSDVDMSGKRNQYYVIDTECVVCGAHFRAARSTAKYCSNVCRRRAQNYPGDAWRTKRVRVCENCGNEFSAIQPLQKPRYCSNACRQAAYRQRKRE